MKINHKVCRSEIKESDDTELSVVHFISTEEKDRGGDIVRADGMKINGKPVVMFSHGRGPMGPEPIAKPVWIRPGEHAGKRGILAKTEFFPDETGKRLYQKTKGGFLHSWSIGYTVNPGGQSDIPYKSGGGREITDYDLVEYSLVSVPMNPGAVNLNGDKQIQFKIMPSEEVGIDDPPQEENGAKEKIDDACSAASNSVIPALETEAAHEEASEKDEQDPPATDAEAPPVEGAEKGEPDDEDMLVTLAANIADLAGIVKSLETKLEDILAAVPAAQAPPGEPAPEGGEVKDGTEDDNPPDTDVQAEPRQPPRLVFVRSQAKQDEVVDPPAPRRLTVEDVQQIVKGAFEQRAKEDINRMRGKVP